MLTKEQKQIIFEIDSQAKALTVEAFQERWGRYIGENSRNLGPHRKTLMDFDLPKSRNKETLIIVGPGPSMKMYEGRLHELKDVATICTLPTALQWTMGQRLLPDYVVVQDSGNEMDFLRGLEEPLIAPTTIAPEVACMYDPYLFTLILGSGLKDPVFGQWNEDCMMFDSDLGTGVLSMGCVTNMAIEIALMFMASGQLKAKRIILLGQDFGGWGGYTRVPPDGKSNWLEVFTSEANAVNDNWVTWNGFTTDPRMIWYKFRFMQLWMRTEAPLYSLSHGMLHEVPAVFFEQVLSGKWPKGYLSKKRIEKMFLEYAALMADTFPRSE